MNLPSTITGLHKKTAYQHFHGHSEFQCLLTSPWYNYGKLGSMVHLTQTKKQKGDGNENSSAELQIKELLFWTNYKMYSIVKSFYRENDSLIMLGIIDLIIGGNLEIH